jgi:hypothetical protein
MQLPSLSQAIFFGTGYVAVCSLLVNVLPKDTVFNAYPRTKTAYNTAVAFLAVSALNLRKCLPAANLKIPFLGFDQYQHDHPELFVDSVTDSVTATRTHTTATIAADEPLPTKQPGATP